ncbi:MAG TPA: murein biosynthesis integral membrane protein MurJ [Candidatus Pacearchaeota archaeon]|nr:murein biosynthesis integral membrane protein MurJ [Candidatus Pacearchaeota archaeon]
MDFNEILNSKQAGIKKATLIMVVSVLISRVLGLLRDRFLAGYFGASVDLDIYFTAFRIPDLVYSIIFAGGITVSFLPIFSEYFKKDKEEAWKIVNYVLNLFFILYFLFLLIFIIFTPQLISYLAPGFDAAAQAKTVDLTRLVFLSVLFFGMSSVMAAILNYFNNFLAFSIAPILYNIGIIFGIIFLSPYFGIFGAGIGVVLGALLYLLVQIPGAISNGFKYRLIFSFKHKAIKDFFNMVGPRIISSSSVQFGMAVVTLIASGIGAGAIAIFNLSNNLRYLPIGVIGIPFATAVFPSLSKLWVEEKRKEYLDKFRSVFNSVLYFSFPVGIIIFMLREQIVRIVFETGSFGEEAVIVTSACLGLYFLSTVAQCLGPILLRGFFSLKDSRTPTIIALFFVIFNSLICYLFVSYADYFINISKIVFGISELSQVKTLGLVFAFNVSLFVEFILLLYLFHKKVGDFGIKEIIVFFIKIILSSIVMALGILLVMKFWPSHLIFFYDFAWFCFACLIAFILYLTTSYLLGINMLKR